MSIIYILIRINCLFLFLIQDNWTALLNAAKDGHVEVSNVLLGNGANIDHRDIVRR